MTPDIFDYVAAANPACVNSIAQKYGQEITPNPKLMPQGLRLLVGSEGKRAFYDVLEAHPDKDVFIEFVNDKYPKKESNTTDYLNFSGTLAAAHQVTENRKATTDLSLMVLAGAVIVAFAIITK